MEVEIKPQFILISDIVAGQLVKMKYIGYSKSESKSRFKSHIKHISDGNN